MKRYLILLLALPMLFVGCGTLAPDGAYKGDKVLYDADLVITTSYDLVHTFVKWEYDNRALLAKRPQVKQYADSVRVQYPLWHRTAMAARTAYVGDPSKVNRTALQQALDVLRAMLPEVNKWIAFGTGNNPALEVK